MSPTSTSPKSHPLSHVDEYLAVGQEGGASDIHLGVNAPPVWRLHGTLQPIWPDAPRFKPARTRTLASSFLTAAQRQPGADRGDGGLAYPNGEATYPGHGGR